MSHIEAALKIAICSFLREANRDYNVSRVQRAILIEDENRSGIFACYIAADFIQNSGKIRTHAAVVPIDYTAITGKIVAGQPQYECYGTLFDDCPPYILEILSPPTTKISHDWRQRCATKPWRYELIIRENQLGSRDLAVMLSRLDHTTFLEVSYQITASRFESEYARLAEEYRMTHIRSLVNSSR